METHDDQPSQENIQEQGTSEDQQEEETVTSPVSVRSYDCTFCKRGFSNAQALGGHMNIHRKDKAKLKKAPAAVSSNINNYENQQSLNISKIRALYDPILPIRPSMEVMGSNTTTAAAAKQWPNWTLGEENDAAKTDKTQLGEVWKLPLFVERSPPLKIDQRAASSSPDEKDLASSSSEEEEEDLDLELRLGPEPQQDSSTSATGTKKFF